MVCKRCDSIKVAKLVYGDGKILIAQRNLKKSLGGLWEFPSGKIEVGESRETAITREIKEELAIDIDVAGYIIGEKMFNYPDKDVNLIALEGETINGDIRLLEHEDAKWVGSDELERFEFATADMFIVEKLRRDECK